MKKYIKKSDPIYRNVMTYSPETEREKSFSKLWQQKRYEEALNTSFPDKWVWFVENIDKEIVCDNPNNAGSGLAFSEKAFLVINQAFPNETKLNHHFEIDGYHFVWFSPPIIEKHDFDKTSHNIFMVRPMYKKIYSEAFVNLWKEHGFSGHDYIAVTQP